MGFTASCGISENLRQVPKASVWLQCGCHCGWTVERFAREDLQPYCRVSSSCWEHSGHGTDAKLPQLTRRGFISSECHGWIEDLVYAKLSQEEVITRVREQVEIAFADDPSIRGGLVVWFSVVACCKTTYSHTLNASVAKLKCLATIMLTGKEAGRDIY